MRLAALVKMPKVLLYPLPEPFPAPNMRFLVIRADVYDLAGERIPSLSVELAWKVRALTCNEKYTLFHASEGRRERIFQIEVYDRHHISHRADGLNWRGPHLRYRDENRRCSAKFACGEQHRERWLGRFLRHTNTRLSEQAPPFQFPLGRAPWH